MKKTSRMKLIQFFGLWSLLAVPSLASSNSDIRSVIGVYEGQIESIEMVAATTQFFSVSGSEVGGKYRYMDGGKWDNGEIFNLRVSGDCGAALGGGTVNASSGVGGSSSGGSSLGGLGLSGAAGKKKNSSSNQVSGQVKQGELCVAGVWRDSYGQGEFRLIFSPTRDYFSGYYRGSPEDAWAIWNGASIPQAADSVADNSTGSVAGSIASAAASTSRASTGVVIVRYRLTNQKTGTLLAEDSITESLMDLDTSAADQANFEEFSTEGVGRTKETATRKAYEFAVEAKVANRVGEQSAGDIGEWFATEARNFDQFKSRYFTPDTKESCSKQSNGQFSCAVRGRLKVLAISADLREFTKKSARKVPGGLGFFFSKATALDVVERDQPEYRSAADALVSKLAGSFSKTGQKVYIGNTASQAITDGKIDFGLSLLAITYENIVAGPNQSEAVIVNMLADQVVEQVALAVSEAVANSLEDRDNDALTRKNDEEGRSTFYIRLVGIDQGERKALRSIRELIGELFPDSNPTTDPEQSDSNQTTIVFSSTKDANHDDVLDSFFEEYEEKFPQFDGEYQGNNEYYFYFQLAEIEPEPEVLCPSDAPGAYPDCNCGMGRRFELNANICVRICPTGAGGAYPNCDCGEDSKYDTDANACVKVCPESASGIYPDCKCGLLNEFDVKANACKNLLGTKVGDK
ncbi:hypothetical protein ACYVVI_05605 [Arenicellales bacterium IMCC57338]